MPKNMVSAFSAPLGQASEAQSVSEPSTQNLYRASLPEAALSITWASTRSLGEAPLTFLDSVAALFSAVPFVKSLARLLWPSLWPCTEPAVHASLFSGRNSPSAILLQKHATNQFMH